MPEAHMPASLPSRRDILKWSAAGALGALGVGCGSSSPFLPPRLVGTAHDSLHIVCGNGSFAWWQLLWPHVEVALADDFGVGGLAYHEAAADGTHIAADPLTGDHDWFASSQAPWIDGGGVPYPGMEVTVCLAGRDETHTQFPSTAAVVSGKADLLAGAAAIQVQESSALLPVIGVDPVNYGAAPGAPPLATVPNADGLVDLFNSAAASTVITIEPTDLSLFGIQDVPTAPDNVLSPTQRQGLYEWGRTMIVAAKGFGLGLVRNVIVGMTPGPLLDTSWVDPHETFNDPAGLNRAVNVAQVMGQVLEGFYQYLNALDDPRHPGRKRIDNIVMTVHGDTPHTPLQGTGWPDATPDGCNWIYAVAKGYLKHGWFGRVHVTPVQGFPTSGFDGVTGDDVPGRPSSSTSTVAGGAIAYAIAKGDSNFVSAALGTDADTYQGLLRTS